LYFQFTPICFSRWIAEGTVMNRRGLRDREEIMPLGLKARRFSGLFRHG
jgi:hypothetical protein